MVKPSTIRFRLLSMHARYMLRRWCAVGRDVQSLMQSGGIRKEIPGSSDLPDGESLGNNSMSEKREILEGVYSIVLQDPHDMAKTKLCES